MVQGVQFRRGTTAEHSVFTGQSGEITVDTDKNVSVIHDGATVGGHPLVGTSTTQRITNKDINGTNINVSGVSTLSGGVQGTNINISGVSTLSGGVQGIGIYSGGNLVTTGIITALNFVGSGNTFAVVGNRIDISIAGGGGGIGTQWVTTAAGIHTLSNVGIGTTNPTSTLSVFGNTLIIGITTLGVTTATNLSTTQLSVSSVSTFINGPIIIGSATSTGTASQRLQVTGGGYVSGNLGIGTTNPQETGLTVLGKIVINQDAASNSRLIFRGVPGTAYRWNIDNDSSNNFRIFREDDATSANGVVRLNIDAAGNVTAVKFTGDGSGLTGIVGSGSGVIVRDDNTTIGTAGTINFGANLSVSPISSGIVTVTITDNVSVSGILTANQVYTSNNGNSQNVRIGDDAWLGDLNLSNTTRLSGVQDGTRGFIVFGNSDTVALGRTGTGSLYYGGDFTVSGVTTANSFRARGGAPGGLGVNNNGYGFFSPGDNDSGMYSSADGQLEFYSNSGEAVRIDSSKNVGIGTTNPTSKLAVSGDVLVTGIVTASSSNITGNTTAATTRFQSVGEETTRIDGNTASLVYNTGGGNIAICTNPTGNITLAVTGIPVDSSFNDTSITFSVFVNQTGTARSCTAVTLNGFNATIRWAGGSLASAISGVTTSSGMDIYSFTGINTVGSASTTANYYLLGVVNGGYR
jgi:hypothetical protein